MSGVVFCWPVGWGPGSFVAQPGPRAGQGEHNEKPWLAVNQRDQQ
nr:MAG TPA: hypothetical protein [Caudoviricetes sp.]